MRKLSRDEVLEMVRRLARGEGEDNEVGEWVESLNASVPHPGIVNLIFHDRRGLTPEQIVDEAFSYQPQALPPPSGHGAG
jgi:hypothetical protein